MQTEVFIGNVMDGSWVDVSQGSQPCNKQSEWQVGDAPGTISIYAWNAA